ncbi:2OG-Fe(II) oxygenase [Caulobacter sp. 17J80-11]|uniref:2OG-Fe(II) oxygenase n=1 Tax=Caulobacter sp. 17J80-11 TaxID=2763502 RepID=UPI0021063681|nr:2OG-Fe(II) oxygenase [Caulobacter sp. 17J80-11]
MDQRYRLLQPGDPAPWFTAQATGNPRYVFDTTAGRYIVLCFFATAGDAAGRSALSLIDEHRQLFDDERFSFFGVSLDPHDRDRLTDSLPGVRYFWDLDAKVSRLYGAAPEAGDESSVRARRLWIVLDPALRVLKVAPFADDGADRAELSAFLEALPPVARYAGPEIQAPVLYLPGVFEAEFCRQLTDAYAAHGGETSGFMRDVGGKTVVVHDPRHKRRADHTLTDESLIREAQQRVLRRLVPEIRRAYQFEVTRMERYLVACYSAEDSGHFRPHRDNTTKGTAHRRFAVSINLNADFDGGEIGFPEYGPRTFKPPVGGAVVFSCSLLHTVTPVTRGRRYAFLPFLYDEAAAQLREANRAFLGELPGGG